MTRFFDSVADRYDRRFAPDRPTTQRDLAPILARISAGDVVLDLGSGTGRAWPFLVERGARVIALDASTEMMRVAGKRASAPDVLRVLADLYAPWPIADRSIDFVLALHAVLAHPPNDDPHAWTFVGEEIARVLRVGGDAYVDVADPAWAKGNLRVLGGDRYAFEDAIVAVVPDPEAVAKTLGFAGEITPCVTGVRLSRVRH